MGELTRADPLRGCLGIKRGQRGLFRLEEEVAAAKTLFATVGRLVREDWGEGGVGGWVRGLE